jgi:Domain of unknown function (DUF4476)
MKITYLFGLICTLSACEGNISMQSENSSRTENRTTIKSQTIHNGDTTLSDYEKNDQSFSESQDSKNIDFNVKDKTGITDEYRKKLKRENDSSGIKDTDTPQNTKKNKKNEKNAQPKQELKANIQCVASISADELVNLKSELEDQKMDMAKLKKTKELFNKRCITSKQARDIVSIFRMESNRLECAKFLYGRTLDPNNFMQVAEEFNFSDTKAKLKSYIQ